MAIGMLLVAGILFWQVRHEQPVEEISPAPVTAPVVHQGVKSGSVTNIYAHNIRLHQGPNFRVYVQWLRGSLERTHKSVVPSFDDPDSFYLNVSNGVIRANIGDIGNYLNAKSANAPLRDIRVSGYGDQVKITGKLHKVFTLPVELDGVIRPAGTNRIWLHVTKINVLKLPFKRLLGGFHVTVSSFLKSGKISGIDVAANDIYFNTEELLPAPHIRGALTKLSMSGPDLEATYGDASKDIERVEQWRNFLRLRDGSLDFGKLTMNMVDLVMVDISNDAWFDLDLVNYQAQLVNGYTRMTPEAGLQIFMPDVSDVKTKRAQEISLEWLKNRNMAPPAEVLPQKR